MLINRLSFETASVSDATKTSADADDAAQAYKACAEDNADKERNQNPPGKIKRVYMRRGGQFRVVSQRE